MVIIWNNKFNISDEIGDKTEQIKKLKESKKYNEIIEDIQKISVEELNKLGVDYLIETKIIKMWILIFN